MHRKEAMRRREVSKRWRLAEREDGASPEARIALWGTLPLASLPCYARQASLQSHCAESRPLQNPGAMLPKVAEGNLRTLCRHWGATKRGWGHEARATSAILFASDMVHTGDLLREEKASGQEARETPTQRQRSHEESDGAEESEHGKAVYTRRGTDGEGPSPVSRGQHRYPVHAQAVHGCIPVELA